MSGCEIRHEIDFIPADPLRPAERSVVAISLAAAAALAVLLAALGPVLPVAVR